MLFAIIFLWTPPHFWALALVKSDDYRRAGMPMLPVVAGDDATRLQILLYTLVLAPVAVLPHRHGLCGRALRRVAAATGAMDDRACAADLSRREGEEARKAAIRLFLISILYLFLLFAVLLFEQVVGLERLSWVASAAVRMVGGAA